MTTSAFATPLPTESIILYLNEIGDEPLLTFDQEQHLAAQIEAGREAARRLADEHPFTPSERWRLEQQVHAGANARAQLINSNLRLVVSIARRYQGHGLSLLDLIQEGSLGLMRAVDKFDPSRGLKFSTYATYWIRQSVGRAIADHGRTVRLPVHLGERLSRLARARQRLTQRLDRDPTPEEVADELGITTDQVTRAEQAALTPASLDETHSDDGTGALAEVISDPLEPTPLDHVAHGLLRDDLCEAMSHLTQRERSILNLRYGLEGETALTLEQIGQRLSLTRERVRQLESEALRKLRDPHLGRRLHGYFE
ncbi:RNA polymerase, sigma 70 subunit, RpoD subfamily [Oscillochloris trichoides DG-6]|uniref:RNA polymerase sigma factor n=1 Tax=Oscillochloris trichoides DG-6 TaxID=765420 RepID=E1IHR5_9CHLR|nr:sigma-70 family RNA polymerase sigma factor [Oscillochloris trichoides]EFO79285.1 RNA polymerase, sigma 70 subunit, RpoD subfamily [Oscillochloris trichoides DG-6]